MKRSVGLKNLDVMSTEMNKLVAVSGLTAKFQDRMPLYNVLQNISFSANKGELVSIVGRTGCGKTTLLRAVGGLLQLRPSAIIEGDVEVFGKFPTEARLDHQIGIITQHPRLFPWMTTLDNICFPKQIIGPSAQGYQNSEELIELVGMGAHKNHLPRTLSGGEQQRAAIARALFYNPNLLLLDEPFASIDAITREQLSLDLKVILNSMGITAFFVTHDLQQAIFLGDKVVILKPSQSGEMAGPQTTTAKIVTVPLPKERDISLMQTVDIQQLERELKSLL
jgi:NitT/TauT family transport system ATP-binding protein